MTSASTALDARVKRCDRCGTWRLEAVACRTCDRLPSSEAVR